MWVPRGKRFKWRIATFDNRLALMIDLTGTFFLLNLSTQSTLLLLVSFTQLLFSTPKDWNSCIHTLMDESIWGQLGLSILPKDTLTYSLEIKPQTKVLNYKVLICETLVLLICLFIIGTATPLTTDYATDNDSFLPLLPVFGQLEETAHVVRIMIALHYPLCIF